MNNFVKKTLDAGGDIQPLLIPPELTNGTALFNPSIFVDGDDLILNLRHCQYTLYLAEKNKFEHTEGPLVYLHPENDRTLTTTNFFCKLEKDLTIKEQWKIDTSEFDIKPVWQFVGLEDARLFRWDGKLYISGVRRDTKPTGEGRMELSEIKVSDDGVKEVSRWRIPPPNDPNSYCEKNWMPIIDMPYHYVKWCTPTEIVKVDSEKQTCETVDLIEQDIQTPKDLRGGTHVIPWNGGHIAIVHEVDLAKSKAGRKNGIYTHRIIVWDKNWKIIKYSDSFSFMSARIEFVCGMAEYEGDLLITFGFQDNAAYILRAPKSVIEDMING
jgi:hypothetical protein